MPIFSDHSMKILESCDPKLQAIFGQVINIMDCQILEGYRSGNRQNKLFESGKSRLRYPESKHNKSPSLAVDAAPYPIDWKDRDRWHFFAGIVFGIASQLYPELRLRWGGNWIMDLKDGFKLNRFDDLCHFEIVDKGKT